MTRRPWVLGLVAALVVGGCSSGEGDAVREAAPMPEGRTEVAGALWEGRIVVAGGYTDGSRASARVDLFDPESDEWSTGVDLPAPYEHAAMAVLDDRLYLVGGLIRQTDGALVPSGDVYSIGPVDEEWRDEPPLATPRGALGLVVVDGSLVAVGGSDGAAGLATTEVYDPSARAWREGPPLPEPLEHLAAVSVGSTVYALGGGPNSGTPTPLVLSLDFPDGQWRAEADLVVPRLGAAGAVVDARPCVAGGEPPLSESGSVECLTGDRWEEVATPAQERHGLVAVAVGRDLHLIGGGSQSGLFVTAAHDVVEIPE